MVADFARKSQVGILLISSEDQGKVGIVRARCRPQPMLLAVLPSAPSAQPLCAWEDEDDIGYSPEDLYDDAYGSLDDDEDIGPYDDEDLEDEDYDEFDDDDEDDDLDYDDDLDDFDDEDDEEFDEDEYDDLDEDEL